MSRRALRRRIGSVIAILLAAGGLLVTVAYFWARGSVQTPSGTIRLTGLEGQVTIYIDRWEIPHIFAATEADAFRAQGYLHASRRLWQMELYQRIARGELSEIFGEDAIEMDRLLRTVDLWGAAERGLENASADERLLLQAYADGVNDMITRWNGPWPPEFWLLGIEPRPWQPAASLAIGKIMALDLSSWRTELARFDALQRLPSDRAELLRPYYPTWGATILEGLPEASREQPSARAAGSPSRIHPASVGRSGGPEEHRQTVRQSRSRLADALGWLSRPGFTASNNWVVGGSKTRDGEPLLANDMHLALRAPSTWFLGGVHAAESDTHVAGLSIPGAPGVIVGYSRGIAWGFTNGMVDDADFAIEAVNLDQSAYRRDSTWTPFIERIEEIQVRGADPVWHTVRETVRGPVITDVLPSLGVTLSLIWTAHGPVSELTGLLAMNRARTPDEFEAAIRRFTSPHQNVVYAGTDGTIGYRLGGTVPSRAWDGASPAPFEQVGEGWPGAWPPDSMPAARDPARGYFATANNLQSRASFGRVGVDYAPPFRANRISERLAASADWTVDGMRALGRDTYSLLARRERERAADAAASVGRREVADALRAWEPRVTVDSEMATLFHVWLYRLRALIAADEFEGRDWRYFPITALLRVLDGEGVAWVDDIRTDTTETLDGLSRHAMSEAIAIADGRRWGEVHTERSVHPLASVPLLDRIFNFSVGPYPAPGGPGTVRPDDPLLWSSLDSTSWTPPFRSEYGPSQRFVARMGGERSGGWFLLPTGQGGNPFSPHYRDMSPRWLDAELIPVPITRTAARQISARTVQLLPGRETRAR